MRDTVSNLNHKGFHTPVPTRHKYLSLVIRVNEANQIAKNDATGAGSMTIGQLEDIRKLINKVAQPGTPDAVYGGEMKAIIDSITEGAGGDVHAQLSGVPEFTANSDRRTRGEASRRASRSSRGKIP